MDIPPQILKKLKKCENEAIAIIEEAKSKVTDFDTSSIGLQVTSTAPLPLMTCEERAQSLAFVVRYEHLPELHNFTAGRHPSGHYYLNEIDQIRAALNEYRTIFYNKKDGICYGTITNLYERAFNPKHPNASMRIEALTPEGQDLSADYLKHLKSRKRAIRYAIERSDFDYIFNGVLQHTDGQYAMQMVKQYTEGSLAYLLLKNFLISQGLKDLLSEHYKVINVLNFPKMGPL
ncbi:MAG: hypothetical protein ABIF19_17660 [Planctomycetota bacterium]